VFIKKNHPRYVTLNPGRRNFAGNGDVVSTRAGAGEGARKKEKILS